ALQLSSKPDHTPFERRAIADADTAAAAANPTAAFPWNLRRPLYLSAAAALLFAAAPFIPPGWPAQAMNLAGLRDGPPKADVQAALADTRAAEHLLRAVTPPVPETSTQAAAAPTERPDPLADLRQQLERGQLTPKEATQQAATTLERAADRLDQQAADAQAAQDLLRDRLALAHRSRDPASDQHTASKFTRALERGDLQRAAEEADRLAQAADALSPQDRAKLAEELKGVADALQRAAPSQAPTPPQTPDTPTPTPQPTPPNPATAPAEKPPEQQADRQVKDLADKLRRAADQLDRPATPRPEQPPSPMPQRPPHQERTPQADQPQTTPREPEPTSQQPAQAQPPRPQQGGPQPGQPPEEPVSEPGDPNQPADRPSNESQPPRQPRPNAQPQQQQPGRKPDPTAATKPQPSPTEHQGRQQQPPDQSADPDPPGGKQPGNPRDQQAPGAQPHPGDQQQPFNEPPKTAKPQPSDQPGGSPTPPEKLPPLDQLRDTLKQIADQQSRPRQDRQDAQSLREQAQKLWNNATPEQRKQV
ncbi:MAG: hypothetical protein K2X91_00765, partial [Thermoleophilia bacterium]|nr:hypothetical protein [Thermoleophilia bacterium]